MATVIFCGACSMWCFSVLLNRVIEHTDMLFYIIYDGTP